ncbi:MAG: agmatinase [Lentisphaeria bacterium]|jgi:agmatinase|nr:agmatinase [Lentisphaeria bacterium]
MNDSAFLASEFPPADPRRAAFHVIPVPYEHTVSYGHGTAAGPAAILRASQELEAFDGTGCPGQAGLHTTAPVAVDGSPETVMDRIRAAAAAAFQAGAVPLVLGGEHTVTFGAVRAAAEHFGGNLGVVQIDAHADLRESYQGTVWSHASVMRRILELGLPIAQFAVRSLSEPEAQLRRELSIHHIDAEQLAREGIPDQPLPADFPGQLYITVDVDGFDASLMPATGTPEPGGLLWWPMIQLLRRVAAGRRIVGLDIVELAPVPGLHHAEFTAAKLAYTLMSLATR